MIKLSSAFTFQILVTLGRLIRFTAFVGMVLLSYLIASAQAAGIQVVHGQVPSVVSGIQPIAHYRGTNRLNLAIGLPLRNSEALTNLLAQIYDPASPNYHHYLTPEQFTERFGPTKNDYQAVVAFARANGLRVTATHPNRMLVDVNGSATDIEKALHVTMRVYQHPTEKRLFHAPDTEPSLDLAVPILSISGLNDYSLPRPGLQARRLATGQIIGQPSGSGPGGTYIGKDFRAAYVPDSSLNGAGQVVGLLQFDGYTASDITYYESLAGLPSITLSNVLIDGASGNPSGSGGELEVSLDIEMAISMATNLSRVVVYMAPNPSPWEDLLNRMADDNVAKQLSCSWFTPGGGADILADQIFQQMAAQGQSFFNASGDADAYTGLINFPGDTPYITQVGGTTLSTSGPGGAWQAEQVWNWGGGIGSGGGISTQYPIPSWQTNVNLTMSQGSTTLRNTPDVALTADSVYVRSDGKDYNVGGTSCAAPLWAGFAALVNQQAVAIGNPVVGFINPAIYMIGTGAHYTSLFHDITAGNNTSSSSPNRFYAVNGYDLCTGWGTPAGQNLINALANPEVLIITPAAGFNSIGPVGGPFKITSQNLSVTNAGKNQLEWTLVNTSLWLDASPSDGTLTPGSPATTVTVSLNAAASNLLAGTYSATIWFTNLSTGVSQNRQFTLNVGFPPVITTEPTNQTVLAGGTASFSVTVAGTGPLVYQWQFDGTNLPANIITAVAGNGATNFLGDGGLATDAGLDDPHGVAVDAAGNLFIADLSNNRIRRVDANGSITTVAGNGSAGYSGDGGPATNASLAYPYGVAVDAAGKLFIADLGNNCIRQVDTNGIISTVAGNGSAGYSGDGGAATNASLSFPFGVAVDVAGDLFIADLGNNCVREVNTQGIINTVAGDGSAGSSGDGGLAIHASLDDPFGVAIDGAGNLFIADTVNNRIRQVDTNGIISTLAGNGSAGYSGDGGAAANANLANPYCVAVDGYGKLFIADTGNNRIREVALNEAPTLTLRPVTTKDVGDYAVIITNAWGSVTSSVAKLTVVSPPVITSQPENQTVVVGKGASFSVAVSGSGPFSCQWQKNQSDLADGGVVAGSATTNLVLSPANASDAGNYDVVITNQWGSVTSSVVSLTVVSPPAISQQPQSLTVTNGQPANFSVQAAGTGPLVCQWLFNGDNLTIYDDGIFGQLLQNGYLFSLGNGQPIGNEISVAPSLWSLTNFSIEYYAPDATVSSSVGIDVQFYYNDGPVTNGFPSPGTVFYDSGWFYGLPGGGYQVVSYASSDLYSGALPGSMNLPSGFLMPGNFTFSITFTNLNPSNVIQLPLATNVLGTSYGDYWLNDGTGNWTLRSTTVADANLVVNFAGTPAAAGLAALRDGGNVSGSATTNLVLGPANATDAGSYAVIITNQWGSMTSSVVTLTVVSPPLITQQPENLTVTNGQPASLNVVVSGTGPLAYQWQFNGNNLTDGGNLSGSGTPNLVLRLTTTNDAGNYTVIISNGWGSVTSSVAVLTVGSPPVITSQPQSLIVANGDSASFSVAVSGVEPLACQWQKNQTDLADGGNLSGAATTNLFLNPATTNDAGNYTVIITNASGSVTSSVASLTVGSPPTITSQPQSLTVAAGGFASFNMMASGTPSVSYQWNFQRTNIIGATNSLLVLSNVQPSQTGAYAVLVSNLFGSILSSDAVLTVTLDHFSWGQIPSPQFVNTPFAVTIQTRDMINEVFTNFTGTALLDSTNGVTVSPSSSGNFLQGAWTGAVVVSQTATNLVLRAGDGLGHFGLANPINVVALPPLNLRVSRNTLLCLWPAGYSGFVLEASSTLSPAAWATVPVSPILIGTQYFVPLQMSGTNSYFRLRFSGP